MEELTKYASLLLVTDSRPTAAKLARLLPKDRFAPEYSVCSVHEAPCVFRGDIVFDVVMIDDTVSSEDGMRLAALAAKIPDTNVLMLARADEYDSCAAFASQHGFMTLASPVDPVLLRQTLGVMVMMSDRLHALAEQTRQLQSDLDDMRVINRAKLILIQRFKMTEKDAHRFIEKNAMDRCVRRRLIAEGIIRTYQN